MEKVIHYCWFGGKPLPKLAKKCIKSWEKFLPDYKIIKWSEENVNMDECEFLKGAYTQKKWAFVADYVRTKALKEHGGIYFDTDMEITKDITTLLNDENTNTFLGMEDSGYVAVGVWYEKNKDAMLPTKLLETYKSLKNFDKDAMVDFTIPKMISEILNEYGLRYGRMEVQHLKDKITIYPRDYFYPYSYDWNDNAFSNNTCMVHYYDASWLSFKERIEVNIVRKFGRKWGYRTLTIIRLLKRYAKKALKVAVFPLVLYRRYKAKQSNITKEYLEEIDNAVNYIKQTSNDYIVIYNKEWKGVTSSTKELFENTVSIPELYRKKEIQKIVDAVNNSSVKQIIFSSFAIGWKDLVDILKEKNSNIKIKTFWHGSHSQILDEYGWERNKEILELHKKNKIDALAFCKESLVDFYKNQNINAHFITNKVEVPSELKIEKQENDTLRIGLYAAGCSDWRKNAYSQIAAVSLLNNVILDVVPLDNSVRKFAKILGVQVEGESKGLSRAELLKRMAQNDVNLYVTFSECAPMLPLESLEVGVPCILGNNNHYFKNNELEKLLVVDKEDNVEEIKQKIELAILNKDKINELYKIFRKENLQLKEQQKNDFLRM